MPSQKNDGSADETRINVSYAGRDLLRNHLPRDISYDLFVKSLFKWLELNDFRIEQILSCNSLTWIDNSDPSFFQNYRKIKVVSHA